MIAQKKWRIANVIMSLLSVLLLIMNVAIFSSCEKTSESSSDQANNQNSNSGNTNNSIEHYEIELNKDNYAKYIKYSITETIANAKNKNGNFYEFKGVLSYAYYKDVMVTLKAQYTTPSWEGGKTYNFSFKIELDAAGNFSFYTNNQIALDKLNWPHYYPGTESEIVVTAVSGKVIFDI